MAQWRGIYNGRYTALETGAAPTDLFGLSSTRLDGAALSRLLEEPVTPTQDTVWRRRTKYGPNE
ncbi:hypothetical protein V1280_004719 [Bradyrhizobium sp. AZCC 2230]